MHRNSLCVALCFLSCGSTLQLLLLLLPSLMPLQKDCMAWSKSRLEQLFANLTLVAGSPQVHTTHLESVQGM